MISLTLFKANFDELNINNLSKRALFDSIRIFYKGNDFEYINFLENLKINYYEKFNNIFELNNEINKEIKIINELASKQEMEKFDFKVVNLFKRNLKEVNDSEYFKLNFDLRKLNDSSKLSIIKDIFINTDSVSLIDFKEIEDERFSLIYHKKGSIIYNDEMLLNNSRDSIQFLENFKVAKDNNFILTRFLLEISKKFKEEGINESFSYTYQLGENKKEVIKDIDEIIFWGSLSKEEKEKFKEEEKQKQEIANKASELAKGEIKKEKNYLRDSSAKDSAETILENKKSIPNVYNLYNLSQQQLENNEKQILGKTQNEDEVKIQIEKRIEDSFKIYYQKEIEKANIKLQRAKKDSFDAYNDLKDCLNNGLSIIDAIKTIQQKYRNEDTINFASLLFNKDILGLKAKEDEIKNLKSKANEYENFIDSLNDEISKREETISKLKGTIQVKNNEVTALKLEYEEELKILEESNLKLKELEKTYTEQNLTIEELNKENEILSQNNKELNNDKIRLETKLENEQNKVQECLKRIEVLEEEVKGKFEKELELAKSIQEKEFLKNSLEEYKDKIINYEKKFENIFSQSINGGEKTEEVPKRNLRSGDILNNRWFKAERKYRKD